MSDPSQPENLKEGSLSPITAPSKLETYPNQKVSDFDKNEVIALTFYKLNYKLNFFSYKYYIFRLLFLK